MTNLKIFSLNTFGVPFAKNLGERIKIITDYVISESPDFVMFQEVGDNWIYNKFKTLLGNIYHFYPDKSPFILNRHSALLFLSKNQLDSYNFFSYKTKAGALFPLTIPELLSNKGLQICKLKFNDINLTIIHTHLSASFFNKPEEYVQIKKQLEELITYFDNEKDNQHVIVGGDLNFPVENELYEYFLGKTKLYDPLYGKKVYTHVINNPTHIHLFVKLGFVWADKKEDYTLFYGFDNNHIKQKVISQSYKYNNQNIQMSDHYGLLTEFLI